MKESFVALLLLTLIIGAGIYIRFDAAAEPIWLDECHTAWTVDANSLAEVVSRAADGNQPPLYFFLVWCAAQASGLSEFSIRIVSLCAGSGLLIAASWFAKKLTDRWSAAFLVAGLIAFDGQFIYYASEARSYALVQLLGLVQAMLFWRLLARPTASANHSKHVESATLVAWTMLSVMPLYCHYTSVWIIAGEALVMSVVAMNSKQLPTKFIIALIVVGASLIPRMWNVSMVFERRSNWELVSSNSRLWADVEPWLVHWILIPAAFGFAAWMYHIANENAGHKPKEPKPSQRQWHVNLWLVLWASIGPIGIATLDWLEIAPMALLRYSAVCWVAMALFAANCLKLYPRTISWAVATVILFSSFWGNWWMSELVSFRDLPTFRNEDWVTTVSQIGETDSELPIFQLADVIEDIDAYSIDSVRFREYLKFPVGGANAVAQEDLQLDERLFVVPTWNVQFLDEQLESVQSAKGCWIVVRGELEYAVHIPGELERYLKKPIEFKFIPNEQLPASNVHLIRVRMTDEEPVSTPARSSSE